MAYANYEDLMELTNQMLSTLVREHGFTPRTADNTDLDFTSQYQRLQFLPALENALDTKLPDPTQLEDSDSLRYAYRCFSWKGGGATTISVSFSMKVLPLCVGNQGIGHLCLILKAFLTFLSLNRSPTEPLMKGNDYDSKGSSLCDNP